MATTFNPFTGNFDFTGAAEATFASLTDKSTADLPGINTPLSTALAAQAGIPANILIDPLGDGMTATANGSSQSVFGNESGSFFNNAGRANYADYANYAVSTDTAGHADNADNATNDPNGNPLASLFDGSGGYVANAVHAYQAETAYHADGASSADNASAASQIVNASGVRCFAIDGINYYPHVTAGVLTFTDTP